MKTELYKKYFKTIQNYIITLKKQYRSYICRIETAFIFCIPKPELRTNEHKAFSQLLATKNLKFVDNLLSVFCVHFNRFI